MVMAVEVVTEIEIDRPREEVAGHAGNPDTAPEWYVMGSRLAFVAHFLGRRLAYMYELVELVPGERLVMRTAEGPFPMETTYTWASASDRGTRMTLRNRGEPSGFGKLVAPFMAVAIGRANRKDLARLKMILEGRAGNG